MRDYWDERFRREGKIWGETASRTAEKATGMFRRHGVKEVLVPGSGYGRNTRYFTREGFQVTGVEVSGVAYALALQFDPDTRSCNASFLDWEPDAAYDAVYCFNTLHLFRQAERRRFIEKCRGCLKPGGLLYFTVFSEKEDSYGKGASPEPDTFESKPGRPVHYFTHDDLCAHFNGTELLDTGLTTDEEDHGEGPHTHVLRFICAREERSG